MPTIFNSELLDGHCIIRDNNNVILIDTGSPVTINEQHNFSFLGQNHITNSYAGLNINKLRELTHINDLTTLMGNDVLSLYKVRYMYRERMIEFYAAAEEFNCDATSLQMGMGVPVINATIGGQLLKFFLDSGARLSYMKEQIARQYPFLGQERDFYPGLGDYMTEVYLIPIEVTDRTIDIKFGIPPAMVNRLLEMNHVDGIIGSDLFQQLTVFIDMPNRRIIIN